MGLYFRWNSIPFIWFLLFLAYFFKILFTLPLECSSEPLFCNFDKFLFLFRMVGIWVSLVSSPVLGTWPTFKLKFDALYWFIWKWDSKHITTFSLFLLTWIIVIQMFFSGLLCRPQINSRLSFWRLVGGHYFVLMRATCLWWPIYYADITIFEKIVVFPQLIIGSVSSHVEFTLVFRCYLIFFVIFLIINL